MLPRSSVVMVGLETEVPFVWPRMGIFSSYENVHGHLRPRILYLGECVLCEQWTEGYDHSECISIHARTRGLTRIRFAHWLFLQ